MSSRHRWALAAWGALVAAACAGPEAERLEAPAEAVGAASELTFDSQEEMEAELEVLDLEIAGLAEYLETWPERTPSDPAGPDPRDLLEAARDGRTAAAEALAAADTARAADSLRAAAIHIEDVKRLLGVAEEMGIEFEPDGALPPATD